MPSFNDVKVKKVFTAEVIAASGSAESEVIDLGNFVNIGEFGLQIQLTGDGTGRFGYVASNTTASGDFKKPTTGPYIKSGMLKTSGEDSDGKDAFNFSPITHRYMKITAEETGTANGIVVTAYLAGQ